MSLAQEFNDLIKASSYGDEADLRQCSNICRDGEFASFILPLLQKKSGKQG